MIRPLSYLNLCFFITGFKILFLKSYVSTDFDVHRNWMSITYNLPIKEWYFDTTSEWTLDYPPLFAVFEFFLAIVAHLLGLETTLILSEKGVRDGPTIIYQKISVIISDIVYYYAIYKLCQSLKHQVSQPSGVEKKENNADLGKIPRGEGQNLIDAILRPDKESGISLMLLVQPGLLMVDHVHFQYNGLLSGIFLLAMASVVDGKYILGSFWFATLLNMKHIYLYCAPAFGCYLLTSYCLEQSANNSRKILQFLKRTSQLSTVVILVFAITFGPFADSDNLKQILVRLFPFKRGLTHAYWAPNLWSLYNAADKVLVTIFRESLRAKFNIDTISRSTSVSSTSGLVQEYQHQYLPTITPLTTLVLVAIFTLPLIIKFTLNIGRRSSDLFIRSVVVASFTAFMFGWHVHEKAIIAVLLALIPVAFRDHNLHPVLLRLTLAGTYSLFPLLFRPAEYIVKVTILISYYTYSRSIGSISGDSTSKKSPPSVWRRIYSLLDAAFLIGCVLIEFYNTLLHGRFNYKWNPAARLNKYDFLPLMLTSSFTALGISTCYIELYLNFIFA